MVRSIRIQNIDFSFQREDFEIISYFPMIDVLASDNGGILLERHQSHGSPARSFLLNGFDIQDKTASAVGSDDHFILTGVDH